MIEQPNTQADMNFDTASDETSLEPNLTLDTGVAPSVDIQIEKVADRQRQITAKIQIPHPVEQIWKVLTDYEALADFIPNLAKSCLLNHPDGGIRLEQVGSQRLLNFNFCARVVLDLQESFLQEIKFCMVEGDFKGFSGSWCLEPYTNGEITGTNLCYTIQVWPKLTMPIAIIENRLSKDLQLNLVAIYQRVQQIASQ